MVNGQLHAARTISDRTSMRDSIQDCVASFNSGFRSGECGVCRLLSGVMLRVGWGGLVGWGWVGLLRGLVLVILWRVRWWAWGLMIIWRGWGVVGCGCI